MYLRTIKKGVWAVYEVCKEDGNSPLLAWCNSINDKYNGSIKRLLAIILQVAETPNGPLRLPDIISHEVNKNQNIYEFIAGDLRLFWFYSKFQKKVIICSCQHIKKGRKANKQEILHIVTIRKNYAKAYEAGEITYIDDEE